MFSTQHIRNFVIIAHIDHGKSTLADRFLELTGTVEKRKMREQFLDQMDLEREKGITIKMQPVRMMYHPNGGYQLPASSRQQAGSRKLEAGSWQYQSSSGYILNLIDTPGHVDFSYEVSRALKAVEGAILLVDAGQGVQAQTLANLNLARGQNLVVIPVINKIDLPGARVEETEKELMTVLGCRSEEILKVSAKVGTGVGEILLEVVRRIPPPKAGLATGGPPQEADKDQTRALIFDSHFDSFRGVIAHIRVFDGELRKGDKIRMLAARAKSEIIEIGHFLPALASSPGLGAGEIGYVATGLKEPDVIRIGDTITREDDIPKYGNVAPLAGYREPKPVVFASVYPENADDFPLLNDALKKIKINDASLFFEPESSDALGRGWRAGFLGMLHMEIIGERLKREYGLELIFTTPSVAYLVKYSDGGEEFVFSPSRLPASSRTFEIKEPWAKVEIIAPQRFLGRVMSLLSSTRGVFLDQEYVSTDRLAISWEVPLRDIIIDFFDAVKSTTEGYGSFGYELLDYRVGDLVRLDVLVAGEREEALSRVVPRSSVYHEGRALVEKLKDLLPKQLFAVAVQAATEGRIIARETLPALKKEVTGYLYGGDRTRKMKLWKKQQRGKKRMQKSGRVEIPPAVFMELLKK